MEQASLGKAPWELVSQERAKLKKRIGSWGEGKVFCLWVMFSRGYNSRQNKTAIGYIF